jgi:hypothetical protein
MLVAMGVQEPLGVTHELPHGTSPPMQNSWHSDAAVEALPAHW